MQVSLLPRRQPATTLTRLTSAASVKVEALGLVPARAAAAACLVSVEHVYALATRWVLLWAYGQVAPGQQQPSLTQLQLVVRMPTEARRLLNAAADRA